MNKGIYAIICKVNGKMYIGYSFNFKTRKNTHWGKLSQNLYKGKNDQLQDDWNLYGKSSFKFIEILEIDTNSIDVMIQEEENCIIRFGTFFEDKGYNISLPVSKKFRKGFIKEYGEEFLRELIHSNDDLLLKSGMETSLEYRYKKVYQINKENQVIRIWNNRKEIEVNFKITKKASEGILYNSSKGNGIKRKTYKGFVWVTETMYNGEFDYSVAFEKNKPTYSWAKPKLPKVYKEVKDYDLKRNPVTLQNIATQEIKNFKSQSEVKQVLGFNVIPLIRGWKSKGGGKKTIITQWRGWQIYKPTLEGCI